MKTDENPGRKIVSCERVSSKYLGHLEVRTRFVLLEQGAVPNDLRVKPLPALENFSYT
jgi:hypothetical protein